MVQKRPLLLVILCTTSAAGNFLRCWSPEGVDINFVLILLDYFCKASFSFVISAAVEEKGQTV
jgi:hypothetical protein